MSIETLHQQFLNCKSVSTDTRAINKGDMFFALKGESFNGNKFALDALEKGAKFAVIDEPAYALNSNFILVDDALQTLQELARFHRNHLKIKIIALTGSNGKTTTKELINAVLQKKYNTVATRGNLNNHIGVPLTLLSMSKSTEIGIIEMGANHLDEIKFLCNIAQPDYGYITNFGKAHLEGFGTIEGVIKGKSELYNYLKENQKLLFINSDDQLQKRQLNNYEKYYTFGSNINEHSTIEFLDAKPNVRIKYNNLIINSNLLGTYNFANISAAIAIGNYFKVEDHDIQSAIETYSPQNNRSQIILKDSNKIVLDAYNANPSSMKAALESFSNLQDEHKIAILGNMFELGQDAQQEHENIAEFTNTLNIDTIYLVGDNFFATKFDSSKIKRFQTFDQLKEELKIYSPTKSTILIKGSRGMAMERVLEFL